MEWRLADAKNKFSEIVKGIALLDSGKRKQNLLSWVRTLDFQH